MTNLTKPVNLVITVAATGSYCYAMRELAQRVAANLVLAGYTAPGIFILAGDDSRQCKDAVNYWGKTLPIGWDCRLIDAAKENNAAPNYKEDAQLVITQLRTAAFNAARRAGADLCWSLDSDTLPPANALRCMMTMLEFDNGYYSVSTCPYPNEAFLGGRGTVYNPIAEDFLDKERVVSEELQKEIDALKLESSTNPAKEPPPEWLARKAAVDKKIKEAPPAGNVWECNAKFGWRRRGWFESAYPAIGQGSVVPSDWCGFGCTLMNREALALCNFDGYDGRGTEDLYVVWRRWYPAKLRINCIPHCPCDHVIWKKKKGGSATEYEIINSFHETEGECVGHLRTRKLPWPPGTKPSVAPQVPTFTLELPKPAITKDTTSREYSEPTSTELKGIQADSTTHSPPPVA